MGSQLGLKSVLGLLVGPMACPSGSLSVQGCHFGRFGGHSGVILGSLGCQIGAKIGLEASGGPHGSPKGPQGAPWEPKGAILADFGRILGSFVRSKSCQHRCHNSLLFRVWICMPKLGSTSRSCVVLVCVCVCVCACVIMHVPSLFDVLSFEAFRNLES